MRAKSSRGRCCFNTYGISTSTRQPTSSTYMLDGSAERSTVSRPIHSSTPSAASGFVFVLLAKTLRSSTFKLALVWIGLFGVLVLALVGYVYWSTAAYVRSVSDRAVEAEQTSLRKVYDSTGRRGLIAAIEDRIADESFEGGVYLLADPSFTPVAGNLKVWPSTLKGSKGWGDFMAREWEPCAAGPSSAAGDV